LQGGLGNSLVPANVDRSLVDEIHWLSDEEAFAATLALARDEKIFAGNSSGSVYAVARWLSRMVAPDTRIVAIFADRGDRYFNTIYDEHFRTEKEVDRLFIPCTPKEVSPDQAVTSWSFARLKAEECNADHLLFIEANTTGSGMLALQKARL
jgi:cysteine synthase A